MGIRWASESDELYVRELIRAAVNQAEGDPVGVLQRLVERMKSKRLVNDPEVEIPE